MTAQATLYVTGQGEMLDRICRRIYGGEHGTTELALAANPGLADRGPVLPEGISIVLPPASAPKKRARGTLNLWD